MRHTLTPFGDQPHHHVDAFVHHSCDASKGQLEELYSHITAAVEALEQWATIAPESEAIGGHVTIDVMWGASGFTMTTVVDHEGSTVVEYTD
jgi:hypothetical protein